MRQDIPAPKCHPVKFTLEATRWARIAAGYTGESLSEYTSRVVAEQARRDIARMHPEIAREMETIPARPAGV